MFAECLYEMLQRDFCYEIYRALEHAPDPEVIKKKAEIARKEQEVKEAAERARKQEVVAFFSSYKGFMNGLKITLLGRFLFFLQKV